MQWRQQLTNKLRQRFYLWLDRRQPAAQKVKLRQHLLFVFPTAYGGWFVVLILLLYLFGANYQNNLILLCAYLLLSLFCFCILAAFFNLYQLTLSVTAAPTAFAHSSIQLFIQLQQYEHKKMLYFSGKDFATLRFETLPKQLQFELYPQQRGYYQLQRFTLQSCYPFGLIRCWTHIQLQQQYWVYPEPAPGNPSAPHILPDFKDQPDQLVPYLPGNPASAIDWKRLAKNPWQPVIRQHTASTGSYQPKHLVVDATGAALEQQLSEFCALLLQFEQQGESYSLSAPGVEISASHGQAHLHRCLQVLALC
jgi:uncharacterized protein (DUF58 family)